jgi:multicomponent Na+:H+ antiporter subunit E
VRRWPVLGVLLAVLWLFVRGVEATPVRLAEELVIGVLVGFPIAYGVRRFYTPSGGVLRALRVAPYAALYLLAFLRELVTANVDVAYRVLAPSMPIDPAVLVLPLRVRSDFAITLIANSITLTPGTLTMDYDAETNTLYVHSIDGSDPEAVVEPIRTWEDYALAIFDEELKPGDPVPEPEGAPESGPRPRTDGGDDGLDALPGAAGATRTRTRTRPRSRTRARTRPRSRTRDGVDATDLDGSADAPRTDEGGDGDGDEGEEEEVSTGGD